MPHLLAARTYVVLAVACLLGFGGGALLVAVDSPGVLFYVLGVLLVGLYTMQALKPGAGVRPFRRQSTERLGREEHGSPTDETYGQPSSTAPDPSKGAEPSAPPPGARSSTRGVEAEVSRLMAETVDEIAEHLRHDEVQFERLHSLREALDRLPEAQREVLVLRHMADLSPLEIADRMKKTESAIHGLLHRGHGALQAALREREAAGDEPRVAQAVTLLEALKGTKGQPLGDSTENQTVNYGLAGGLLDPTKQIERARKTVLAQPPPPLTRRRSHIEQEAAAGR